MRYVAPLLAATVVVTIGFAETALAQTQPRQQVFRRHHRVPDPEEAARWKEQCESLAKEKHLKGKRRSRAIAKCVKSGEIPPELN
jgi:hypothetical protein